MTAQEPDEDDISPMSAESLCRLVDRVASAAPSGERALFEEARPLLTYPASSGECARWRRYLRAGAFHDLAAAIFTAHFPGWGFQFGTLAGPASKSIANIWREGDAQSSFYQAATPALALLRATVTEAANASEAHAAAQCPACAGRGWFVTTSAGKQVCRHEGATAAGKDSVCSRDRIRMPEQTP